MRVRYGKPIKVKSLVEKQNVLSHANHNINHICFNKNNSFSFSSELPFSSAAKHINIINGHKYFCFVKLNFTPTGTTRFIMYKGDGTVNGALSSGSCDVSNYYYCALINVTYNNPDAHLNFYLNTYQFVNGDILFGGIIDLTELGLDNLTAQEFYNKYNRYFSLIATGEEITIDDKAGQIAYKNLEEDSIRCKIAGGSSDIYYGYNQKAIFDPTVYKNQITYLSNTKIQYIGNSIAYPKLKITYIQNHKYYFKWNNNGFGSKRYWLNATNYNAYIYLTEGENSQIYNYNRADCAKNHIEIGSPLPEADATLEINIIDLTDWFGAGNEPITIAEFKEKFQKDWYGCCPTPIKLTRYQIEALPSYGYNQLVTNTNKTQIYGGITIQFKQDGSTILNGTATSAGTRPYTNVSNYIKKGDIVLFMLYIQGTVSGSNFPISVHWSNGVTVPEGSYTEPTLFSNLSAYTRTEQASDLMSYLNTGITFTNLVISNIQVINLTDWYGAGNEPTTIEEFKQTFPNKYYPYSKKRLLNKYMINKLVN